ncbi:MAG: prolipoprotein diacylglyceryl transferase [Omnitrophica bacterium RIFCSPLOWO2_12_FULL_50_11]|nr:MAG: prolipoprotein diacylglyceryl transferase [Omnitrophica bacterium RIFCSPLOWO2_12_FULL_50_11]
MYPTLFSYAPLTIHSYGVMVGIGILIAIYVLRQNAQQLGVPPNLVVDLALFVVFLGFLGARIFYVGLYWDYFRAAPLEIIQIWKGGLVWYGGLAGGLIGFYLFTWFKRLPLMALLDLFVPAVALAQGFGRMGCFLNGCCFGIKTNVPWAVQFPFSDHSIHPTQLYESGFCFVLAGFLFLLWRSRLRPGLVSFTYFLAYPAGRFFLEFLRGDNPHVFGGLTRPQLVSLGVVVVSAVLFTIWSSYGAARVRRTS